MEKYQSNSYRSKEEQKEPEKKVEKVVSGKVKTKRKSELRKFTDIFVSEDVSDVKSYILMDVLIPAIKETLFDMLTNGAKMVLFGEAGIRSKGSNNSKVSYTRYYDKAEGRRRDDERSKTVYSYDDIILDSRGEAEMVLSQMDELIATYNVVSVADLFDLVGLDCRYTDNNYGWYNIRNAAVVPARGGGYLLRLPKALPLN